MDYSFLQHYWWFLVSLLGGILSFLLFVQGGQTLIYKIGRNAIEQTMIINALGHKWELTYTTLVLFGGALFASFPLFYSTSFGGAYWVWIAILFCFVIQAVSYEFRSKANNILGKKTYESFLMINGFGGVFLLGTALATFFTGSEFSVEQANIANIANPVISEWQNPWHGLEALANPLNPLLGMALLFLSRTLGALFLRNRLKGSDLFLRLRKEIFINGAIFLIAFLTFLFCIFTKDGFAFDPQTQHVYFSPNKYLLNLIQMPIVATSFLIGVLLVLMGWWSGWWQYKTTTPFWIASLGTVLTVTSLLLTAGWNNTAYYPSTFDLQSSLTIFNSSSSHFTLEVMAYVSLMIPFVIAYITYVWYKMDKKKITESDVSNTSDTHVY